MGTVPQTRTIRLPNAPGLWLSAGLEGGHSATGTGESATEAEARRVSETAEAMVLASLPDLPTLYGFAASPEEDAAHDAARFELIERLAALLWWRGEAQPTVPDDAARAAFDADRQRWGHRREGEVGLLDLSPAAWPPVLLAWSGEAEGAAPCFGLAARDCSASATRAALRELCQMEFGLALVRRRRDAGLTLGESDQRALDRAAALTLAACPLIPGAQNFTAMPDISVKLLDPALGRHVALATFTSGLTRPDGGPILSRAARDERGMTGWPLYL